MTTSRRYFLFRGIVRVVSLLAAIPAGHALAVAGDAAELGPQQPASIAVRENPFERAPLVSPAAAAARANAAAADVLPAIALEAGAPAEEIANPAKSKGGDRPFRRITEVTIDVAMPPGVLPGADATTANQPPLIPDVGDVRFVDGWAESNYQWSATMLCHRPLYFEQVNLERYGYTVSPVLQPAISGAHFFTTIAALPYKLVAEPPRECVYTLGHYRPGSLAPRRWHHTPVSLPAAAVEAGVIVGLVFLIP